MNATAFDAFISYSSKNKQIADAVKHGLHSAGIRCWMAPDDIQPGRDWAAEVADAIEACSVMVLIWTRASMSSVEVPKELGLAMSSGSIVIPFRLENIEPHGSFKYHLAGRHWLDAYDTDLDESIRQLTELVRTNIDKLRASPNSASLLIDTSEAIVGIGADMRQAAEIANQDKDYYLGTSPAPFPPQIINELTVEPLGSNHSISGVQDTAMPDLHAEEINKDALDDEIELIVETCSIAQDCRVSASSDEFNTFEQIAEGAEAILSDGNPEHLDSAAEESGLGAKPISTNPSPESDEVCKLAREIKLICYLAEVLVPELDRTIFKESFVSRIVMGAKCAPSTGELIEEVATKMHFTFLLTSIFCLVSSVDNIRIDMIREFIGSGRIRSGSRFIYENAARILRILLQDEYLALDARDLEDCNHDVFVGDADCCVEISDSEGACVFRFIDPSTGDIIFDTKNGSFPADRINDAFARILDVGQYHLSAVLSVGDIVAPSDPSLCRIAAERLSSFVYWSLDAAASSVSEFLDNDDICDMESIAKLKSMTSCPAIENAIARLSGCRKVDSNKKHISSLNISFDQLMKLGALKAAAGMVVQC